MMRKDAQSGNHCAKTYAKVTAPKPNMAKINRTATKAKSTNPITLLNFSNSPNRNKSYCVFKYARLSASNF